MLPKRSRSSSKERDVEHKGMSRKNRHTIARIFVYLILFSAGSGVCLAAEGSGELLPPFEEKRVLEWRKERDQFFRTHDRSPLLPKERKGFKGLKYYAFDPRFLFSGRIERYVVHIDNPRYYATFLTNKGTNKRYIRYGKFHFGLDGKPLSLEVYKSILSDKLFIPFKDRTNGKETYEGGRYLDAEILTGYRMILDFNMAYHPNCAYNEKFTCALPPKENFLEVEIRAGEKNPK
jgi:uncharacterized protein